jgi:hypothetical protein
LARTPEVPSKTIFPHKQTWDKQDGGIIYACCKEIWSLMQYVVIYYNRVIGLIFWNVSLLTLLFDSYKANYLKIKSLLKSFFICVILQSKINKSLFQYCYAFFSELEITSIYNLSSSVYSPLHNFLFMTWVRLWNICVTFMPYHRVCSWINTTGATREQSLLTLLEHRSSSPIVTRACFVDRCLSFCLLSFGHCVVSFFFAYRQIIHSNVWWTNKSILCLSHILWERKTIIWKLSKVAKIFNSALKASTFMTI